MGVGLGLGLRWDRGGFEVDLGWDLGSAIGVFGGSNPRVLSWGALRIPGWVCGGQKGHLGVLEDSLSCTGRTERWGWDWGWD